MAARQAADVRIGLAIAALLLAPFAPARAQDGPPPDAQASGDPDAEIPNEPWYPDGYFDVRMAAEAQIADTPRSKAAILAPCASGGGTCYALIDPAPQQITADETDPSLVAYGNIALDVSRLRQELARVGYPDRVYAEPLAAYEREFVDPAARGKGPAIDRLAAALETNRETLAPRLPHIVARNLAPPDPAGATGGGSVLVVRSGGPSAAQYPAGRSLKTGEPIRLKAGDTLVLLDSRGTRTLRGPGTFDASPPSSPQTAAATPARPRLGAVRGIAAPRGRTIVSTTPPGGEVLLVSAFAFKLCARKQRDSWDRFACSWNEIETGVGQNLAGRYVYQVRWPDGTVRKGTREIAPDYQSGTPVAVTFKKVGS